MPRHVDADALKDYIYQRSYLLHDSFGSYDRGMFTVGIFQCIDEMTTISADVEKASITIDLSKVTTERILEELNSRDNVLCEIVEPYSRKEIFTKHGGKIIYVFVDMEK